jgi:hypothetical protein
MAGRITKNTIQVQGLTDLNRAFSRIDKTLKKSLTNTLKEAAEPVRQRADQLGPQRIHNLHPGDRWSINRVGVTQRAVYVAPTKSSRGRDQGKKRPNFRTLMLDRVYEPALEQKKDEVLERFDGLLDDITNAWRL